MVLDGVGREDEALGDLEVRQAGGEEASDLALARGDAVSFEAHGGGCGAGAALDHDGHSPGRAAVGQRGVQSDPACAAAHGDRPGFIARTGRSAACVLRQREPALGGISLFADRMPEDMRSSSSRAGGVISSTSLREPNSISPGEVPSAVKASAQTTAGRVAVIEHLSPRGSGSPLHVHSREDEWFYVIEGELTFWVGGQVIDAPAGSFVYGPRGIPHTFLMSSETARFLLVTEPGDFSGFLCTLAQPADAVVIPPRATEPPNVAAMSQVAAEYGIEILGPPGIPA